MLAFVNLGSQNLIIYIAKNWEEFGTELIEFGPVPLFMEKTESVSQ